MKNLRGEGCFLLYSYASALLYSIDGLLSSS